ncbi:hypothetical protein [Vibrio fluvialis]|uniref:hypothetical protein n=1 Tax=Vibrio fluvialis TaxID=676 RepID=UPI00399A3BC8
MLLANRVVLPDMWAVRKHQKNFRCEFERVIKRDNDVVRYYSKSSALLIGLYIEHSLETQGDQIGRLVYLQCFGNSWYGAVFVDGLLLDEHIDSLSDLIETLGYDLHLADKVWVSGGEIDAYKAKQEEIDALVNLETLPDSYQLKTPPRSIKSSLLIGIGTLLVFLVVTAIVFSLATPKSPKSVQHSITPEQQFTMSYGAMLSAGDALANAIKLSSELALMPEGMSADAVRLVAPTLQSVIKYGAVRDKVKREWFSEHKTLAKSYVEDRELFDIPVETMGPLVIYDVADYLQQMRDALELIGVKVSTKEPLTFGSIQKVSLSLEMRGSPGLLPFIQEIIDAPMVTVGSLELVRESKDQVKLSLEIDVTGASNNE